ncbi:MAG: phytoene desaturase family protein [Bacillota bacterium]
MDKKKIVIVGGGVSGLTAGIYALKSGFDAEIYEKNSVVGGECTGWDRRGYHIDNCIHWLMGTKEGSALHDIWKTVGAVDDGVEIVRSDRMYTSELGGEKVTLWQDADRTERELIALSPEDEAEIRRLMGYVRVAQHVTIPAEKPPELMGLLDLLKMIRTMKDAMKLFRDFAGQDTLDLMNRFKHPLIRCLISDFCTVESQAQSFPMAYGNFISGDGGIPRGGSRAMALRMQRRFEDLGGKVFTNANVGKVELNEGTARGIRLAGGEFVSADYVICACDTSYTFGHLLDESHMDPVLREMYQKREAYPVYGMFQVAFAVDSDLDAIGGDVMLDCSAVRAADWMSGRMSVKSYAYEPSFAPEGKQVVQVLVGLKEAAYDYWSDLYQRPEEYQAKKLEIAEKLRLIVEGRFAAYQGKMTILDSWTPVTYRRYCNAYKGYNQSFMLTKHSAKNPYPKAWINGIDNVVLAGQWLVPPGGLPGAGITGKYAVQRILKREKRSIKI